MKTRLQTTLFLLTIVFFFNEAHATRFYSPNTARWLSRDPIVEKGGLNLYGMVGNDPINKVDKLGKHAAVINHGGYCGHTAFAVTNPNGGGVRVFHYYAKGHRFQTCCGLSSLRSLVCDKASVWYEDRDSFQQIIDMAFLLDNDVKVLAFAFGASSDDKMIIDELSPLAERNATPGYYSLLLGNECHWNSWHWFRQYVIGGREVPANWIYDTIPRFTLPNTVWLTPAYDREHLPSFP